MVSLVQCFGEILEILKTPSGDILHLFEDLYLMPDYKAKYLYSLWSALVCAVSQSVCCQCHSTT